MPFLTVRRSPKLIAISTLAMKGVSKLYLAILFLVPTFPHGRAGMLYKRMDAKPALWHHFAYAKVPHLRTLIECGGACSSDHRKGCKGFVFRSNERECILLQLAAGSPAYTILGGPQVENAIYYNGRKDT